MKIDGLKEVMCALIGAGIVLGSAWLLYDIYLEAGRTGGQFSSDVYQRHIQILNLALGFAGTVIGYYFGRTPAEKLATAAQAQAKDAIQNEERVKTGVRNVKDELSRAIPPAGGGGSAPQVSAIQLAIQKLEQLL